MEIAEKVSYAKLNLHIGNALKYITFNYPDLKKVVLELIQNSLDSEATEIMVIIDYKTQSLCVRDNGSGISVAKFEEAIGSVCNSTKQSDKLGQFGIGLLSPLGKCKGFLITSAARADKHSYNRWIFDSERILKNSELPEIPVIPMPGIFYSRSSTGGSKLKQGVNWRTEVVLDRFSKDKSVNSISLSGIQALILGQFSEAMRRLDAKISIVIKKAESPEKESASFKAASFSGESLGQVVYGNKKEGESTFDVFLSPKTKSGRKGQLLIGISGNDFRLPMAIFLKSVSELDAETVNILLSGTFEGSIVNDSCLLHQNRKEFFENEARMSFLIHLESWVKNHARKHIASIKDSEKDTWLQAVGSLAISQLEDRLKSLPHLLGVVKSFKIGTVGVGHYGFNEAKTEQGFISSAKQFSDRDGAKAKGKGPRDPNFERNPISHENHTPLKVAGPNGTKRRFVKGHSTGLQFVFEEMPGNDNHWEFDSTTGVLCFNMRSDVWAKMETSERNLILYQQYVAIKALELQLEPPVVRPQVYEFLQRELKSAASFITATSVIHPRQAASEVGRRIKKI